MLRFIDGFDHYATADILLKWTQANSGSSATTIVAATGRNGTGAFNSLGGVFNGWMLKTLDSQPTWIVGFGLKLISLPTNTYTLFALYDSGNTQVELNVNSIGVLTYTRNGTVIGTGTTVLTAGVFYFVEFKATISSSCAAGTCAVNLGGLAEITIAAGTNTKSTSNATANQIKLGSQGGGPNGGCVIDDFYACDGTGSTNNSFLGDVRVEVIYPNAAGTVTQMTPLSGANYASVNQTAEDGDTTYVATSTVGNEDTYLFGSLSSSPGTIFGVQMNMVARKDDAGSRLVAAIVRNSSTDYAGSTKALADGYAMLSEVREINPATGTAWTGTTVNALEAGIKLVG
jgi:hypothetical protein